MSLRDLYRSYTSDREDDDYYKDNMVVLTSKESLDKRIIYQNICYRYGYPPR